MKYVEPIGAESPDASYVNANPGADVEGSPVPAGAIEFPMREIVAVIKAAGLTPSNEDLTQLSKAIYILTGVPVGMILPFAGIGNPGKGWLFCNGATVKLANYPELYAVIGDTYGSPALGEFKIPDLRGEFMRGLDSGRGVDSGRGIGSAQAESFKSHSHGLAMWASTAFDSTGGPRAVGADTGGVYVGESPGVVALAGGNETRPRNIAFPFYIKAF